MAYWVPQRLHYLHITHHLILHTTFKKSCPTTGNLRFRSSLSEEKEQHFWPGILCAKVASQRYAFEN